MTSYICRRMGRKRFLFAFSKNKTATFTCSVLVKSWGPSRCSGYSRAWFRPIQITTTDWEVLPPAPAQALQPAEGFHGTACNQELPRSWIEMQPVSGL